MALSVKSRPPRLRWMYAVVSVRPTMATMRMRCMARVPPFGVVGGLLGLDVAGAAVDRDAHPGSQPGGGVAAADDGGDSVLAGDDRGVRRGAPDVGHDGGGTGEERGPGRRRHRRHQDLAVLEVGEL